jgi:DNA-binding response OmpR family regulator
MQNIKTILIVEDDATILFSLKTKFEAETDIKVVTATDGELGLHKALNEKPDLILLDLILPKMLGMDLLRQLRKDASGKDVPVIIMSNLSEMEDVRGGRELGVKDYVVKADWPLDDVVKLVKKYLQL